MNKINNMYVYIKLYDFKFEPEEITKILKHKPSKDYLKGDKVEFGSRLRKYNGWHSQKTNLKSAELNKHIEKIFKMIPRHIKIKNALKKSKGALVVVVHIKDEFRPVLSIDKKQTAVIGSLGLDIEIDYYP
ncbi:MAG: DUF4279 domain-containing protein [Bdellovibrionales bacterium]|nr:DUF4279 domain-containing protein [Bdellovibrionales bacterium]